MLTVYGIKSCDTCRKARKYFAENDIEFRFHDVRDDGLDIQMLERWAENPTLLKRPVLESETFIAVGFSEKRFSEFWKSTS